MDVARYTFQSPYPSQIQIGRPDPTVKQEDKSGSKEKSELPSTMNETQRKSQSFEATQKKEVQAVVTANNGQQVAANNRAEEANKSNNSNKPEQAGKSSGTHGLENAGKPSFQGIENNGKSSIAHQMSNAKAHIDTYA